MSCADKHIGIFYVITQNANKEVTINKNHLSSHDDGSIDKSYIISSYQKFISRSK
jgi:hypothetical protein